MAPLEQTTPPAHLNKWARRSAQREGLPPARIPAACALPPETPPANPSNRSRLQKMTDTEMLNLLGRIMRGEGSDAEVGVWIQNLERATRCPHLLNILRDCGAADTPETVLRKAREYRAIQL